MNSYRRCSRCVMDNTSDKTITFDEYGCCNYCTQALLEKDKIYFPNPEGEIKIHKMIKMLKEQGYNKQYDCIMGISGGLDSAYLAYLGYKWGLRILAVHIDDGYDTEISKNNIEKLCKAANIDLKIIKPDFEQYNALTKAYMKAGVPSLAIPQDNILFAYLYDLAKTTGIKYFLSGGNFALESILQQGNGYSAMDVVNIKDINRLFGTTKLNKLKFISIYRKFYNLKTKKAITLRPLDYIDYNRKRAFQELKEFCGFEYYGQKHLENILTAFIQLYWLPNKFKVDKRTSHLSSMIISGQITREQALEELTQPMYDENMMNNYIAVIKKNMHISDEEFDAIMAAPTHQHTEYKIDKMAFLIRKLMDKSANQHIKKCNYKL